MFFRVFALLALVAVAFASPKPDPQVLAYSAGAPLLPAVGYSPYSSVYSPYVAAPAAAAYPYAYSGYYLR